MATTLEIDDLVTSLSHITHPPYIDEPIGIVTGLRSNPAAPGGNRVVVQWLDMGWDGAMGHAPENLRLYDR